MNSSQADLMAKINDTGDFGDETKSGLKAALESFSESHSW